MNDASSEFVHTGFLRDNVRSNVELERELENIIDIVSLIGAEIILKNNYSRQKKQTPSNGEFFAVHRNSMQVLPNSLIFESFDIELTRQHTSKSATWRRNRKSVSCYRS